MKVFNFFCIYIISILFSCKGELDIPAQGVLSPDQISTYEDAEALAIAAYSQLGNDHYNYPFSLWPFGNVRSDDAYKGGNNINDIGTYNELENPQIMTVNNARFDQLWYRIYIGVRRTNEAIRALKKFDSSVSSNYDSRLGEMYFIRGYWYLKLKMLFKHVVYLTDETPIDDYETISNRVYSDQELWELIADDFKRAIDLLPSTQPQIGRANKYAAYAYYAKTRLYQAYVQNEDHEVINIDRDLLNEVVDATGKVLESSYELEDDFANNFIYEKENGKESIFAVQFSTDDGVGTAGRTDKGYYITAPQGMGCCDFHKVSHNLINAFKTENGLPMFTHFNDDLADFSTDNFDPRLDHTAARPGMPWKYNANEIFTNSWSRTPGVYGYFNSLKENVSRTCDCYKIDGSFRGNSKNRIEMRFADVLLFRAEALIELDDYEGGITLINRLRERAANSIALLKDTDGNPRLNYQVEQYVPGLNITLNKTSARHALRFERRLEMAMENSRFFDLVRWGISAEVINTFYQKERVRMPNLYTENTVFTAKRNEYLPIPQAQVNWSKNLYIQNVNYQ
ncbi:RagB/SusD family nutrient uptake outer membrane protein [Sphingobacterium phlebotomi]|uniref:RagB/SusD family nutrient uptake outer membrane protein n=1 Tax=Sphingobacterium phlebotomi TaxID=2605433 RepID=A0A5D4H000_9SPHI|nr:RagB/SusD family nutrient uptake outer membrane protein [Sphingobacterium phlebotomi]TYR33632.1 RagB/SusD family nutrient uptake outer membrane protein [Sphingobacterium phlebotomi]